MRLVQKGVGEERDLVVVYFLARALDHKLCTAAPDAIILNDTRTPAKSNEYRYVGPGGLMSLEETEVWALEQSGALAVRRVIVVSYSAGYKAIRALLQHSERQRPDVVVTCDGTHASDPPGPGQIEVWRDLANEAKDGERVWIASHTQIVPPTYMGTRAVLEAATGWELASEEARRFEGGLQVWSYPGAKAEHHRDQAQRILPLMLAEALAMGQEEPVPDTAPAPHSGPPSPRRTLAAAVFARAQEDLRLGVREDLGRNDGRRIREYCQPFGVRPPCNWCAVGTSTWILEGSAELGISSPVAGSPGAQALGAQFRAARRWVGRHAIRDEHLLPGNVIVWRRGPPGDWRGHVGVIAGKSEDGQSVPTIEPNSGPRSDCVAEMKRSLDDPQLLGIGLCTTFEECRGSHHAEP
jgi:hypothetical protein